jgi:hypothetical protein
MFRGVVKFDLPGDSSRLFGRKSLIEGSGLVRVQVVEHDANELGLGEASDHMFHALREVDLGSALGDEDFAPTALGRTNHHQVADAVALVFGVLSGGRTRLYRDRLAHLGDQLLRAFIEADQGIRRIVGRFIQIEHVFHRRDEIRADLRNAPFLLLPGLERVFLRAGGLPHD